MSSIEKRIELKASVSRVWRALTDHREFGEWFRVKLDGPFVGSGLARPHYLSRLRAREHGKRRCRRWSPNGSSRSPGIRMRSIRRSTTRRAHHLGRVQEPKDGGTVLVLTESGSTRSPRPPVRSFPNERGRLDRADDEHCAPCRATCLDAVRSSGDRASVFAALGDETRLSLIAKLSNGSPQSISRLAEGSTLTRQAITKHLRVLEDARVVHSVRVGREACSSSGRSLSGTFSPTSNAFPTSGGCPGKTEIFRRGLRRAFHPVGSSEGWY